MAGRALTPDECARVAHLENLEVESATMYSSPEEAQRNRRTGQVIVTIGRDTWIVVTRKQPRHGPDDGDSLG